MANYRPHDEPVAGYKLLELLGEGAFGSVWKAEGPGGVLVALKIISKLNGMHAIREWQSLQAVKNLKHSNLVNIYGVWLKNEQGHVLSTDEVLAMLPQEAVREPVSSGVSATPAAANETVAPRRTAQKRRPQPDGPSATLACDTLQVGGVPSTTGPDVSPSAAPASSSGSSAAGRDSPDALGLPGSTGSGSAGSQESAGSAGSRERWASMGNKVPPLELVTAMTLGDGTLLDRLKRCQAEGQKGIPRPELLEHLRDAVKGLQYLNDHDVHHCDVKPENLLVVGGSVQVCDYGSALRAIYAAEARTSQGYTEQYAAPEQLGAKKVKVNKATDLYALAITYYALRTGKFPWSDHAEEPIPVLKYEERFDFTALDRQSRFRYERDVLRRALRRDPKERQRSVTDFLTELERAIAQESQAEAAARRRRRRLAGWLAIAAVLLGLAATGYYYRDRLPSLFRPSSDRARLALMLSENRLDDALALAGRSPELSKDEETKSWTKEQLFKAIERLAGEPNQTDDEIVQMAGKVPEELRSGPLDELIVRTIVQPELGAGNFAAAAAAIPSAEQLPGNVHQRAQQEIYDAWLPAARAKEQPALVAAEFSTAAAALPGFRTQLAPLVVEQLNAGIAAADAALSERTPGDWQSLADECRSLAAAASQASSFEPSCRELAYEARLRELAALVQGPHEKAAIQRQTEALASDTASSGAASELLTARIALIGEYASERNRLDRQAIESLARLAVPLKINPAKVQSGQQWDVGLYRNLLTATFAAAAADLSGVDEGALEALRRLPAGGGVDLQIAQALLVQASKSGADGDDLVRVRKWLDESTSLKSTAEAKALAAFNAWLELADNRWFDAATLAGTLAAIDQWHQQPGQEPLAETSLVAVLSALVERSEERVAAAGAAFPADVGDLIAAVDRQWGGSANAESAPLAAVLAEASDRLHAVRLRHAAVQLSPQGLKTIAADMAAIEQAIAQGAAAGNAQRRLPPLSQPLAELELAALAVEVNLHQPEPGDRPETVQAAWDKLREVSPPADQSGPPEYDADYVSFVRDLAALRGWEDSPPAAALERQAVSPSPWLASPLRRSTAAAELLKRNVGQLPLPRDLLYAEATGPTFAAAAARLDLARAWDAGHPAAAAWLPICRMYERATPDWAAIRTLSQAATSNPQRLAALEPSERLHLWLASARSWASMDADPAAKRSALHAYASILRDPQLFDPLGSEGEVTPGVWYSQVVEFAVRLLPADPGKLSPDDPARASAAAVLGAKGALLEGDFSRELAAEHFGYPKQPLAFIEATRDAFAAAAQLDPDPQLRLRWITGQARAEDLLLSRLSEEVPAEKFEPLRVLSGKVAQGWPDTFEANVLAGIVEHYQSRVAASEAERGKLLLSAARRLELARAALESHERASSPWCLGWLSQTLEALSKIALEQSHMQPWGLEKQRLLKLAVERAGQAEAIDVQYRISPTSCLICAGNAYEDLAVHLFCLENFAQAEEKFQAAARMPLDQLTVQHAEASLGRVLVRRTILDPVIEKDATRAAEYQQRAIDLLERVSGSLREGQFRDLGLAHEAEYYLAEAYLRLAGDVPKAESLYARIAQESKPQSFDRIDCLLKAAACRARLAPRDALLIPAFFAQFGKQLAAIDEQLTADSRPDFRVQLVRLRFKLATTFAEQQAVVEPHLEALGRQKGDAAVLAQCEILLNLEVSSAQRQATTAQRQEIVERCARLIDQIADQEEQLGMRFKLLSREQALWAKAADEAQQAALAVGRAAKAIESIERALAVAVQVNELQETVSCTPEIKKQKFDTVKATLPLRRAALEPVRVLFKYGTADKKYEPDLQEAQAKVQKWWLDVKLYDLPAGEGGPTPDEKRQYLQQVRS